MTNPLAYQGVAARSRLYHKFTTEGMGVHFENFLDRLKRCGDLCDSVETQTENGIRGFQEFFRNPKQYTSP